MEERKRKIDDLVDEIISDQTLFPEKEHGSSSSDLDSKKEIIFDDRVQSSNQENVLSFQRDKKDISEQKNGLEKERTQQNSKEGSLKKDEIQTPTENELSMFTQNITHIKNSIKKHSQEKELKALLEIKNKEIKEKEKLLVEYKIERDQFKDQVNFYKKIIQDEKNKSQETVQKLSESLQETIQKFIQEESQDSLKKAC